MSGGFTWLVGITVVLQKKLMQDLFFLQKFWLLQSRFYQRKTLNRKLKNDSKEQICFDITKIKKWRKDTSKSFFLVWLFWKCKIGFRFHNHWKTRTGSVLMTLNCSSFLYIDQRKSLRPRNCRWKVNYANKVKNTQGTSISQERPLCKSQFW